MVYFNAIDRENEDRFIELMNTVACQFVSYGYNHYMIEIEKKFILNEVAKARLLEGAEFLSEKTIHDEYFDTEDFSLTKRDWWLRSRNGHFELKIANHEGIDRLVDSYKEIEDETEIKKILNFPVERNLKESQRFFVV